MRTTGRVFQQHIGEMFLKHWKVQGRRVLRETPAVKHLKQRNIPTCDALDFIKQPNQPNIKQTLPVAGYRPKAEVFDSTHPDYQKTPCLTYKDHNVLLEGLPQAKVLTNTVEIQEGTLPTSLEVENAFPVVDDEVVQRIIKSSLLYDAYQELLPKRKDPERPAWNFAREYGITDRRRNLLLCNRLMSLCACWSPTSFSRRKTTGEGVFEAAITRCGGQPVLLSLRADLLITSDRLIAPVIRPEETRGYALPNIEPLLPTVSLENHNLYKLRDVFPLKKLPPVRVVRPIMTEEGGARTEQEIPGMNLEQRKEEGGGSGMLKEREDHVHTIVVHLNETEVANLYETEVTESQVLGRSLLKCYTSAVAQARHKYGNDVADLKIPVVVQCVHTDGKLFHFSVFQLNTLREPGEGRNEEIRNVYWSLPRIPLYDLCEYTGGRPVLEGYNPRVFKYLMAFYNNS